MRPPLPNNRHYLEYISLLQPDLEAEIKISNKSQPSQTHIEPLGKDLLAPGPFPTYFKKSVRVSPADISAPGNYLEVPLQRHPLPVRVVTLFIFPRRMCAAIGELAFSRIYQFHYSYVPTSNILL